LFSHRAPDFANTPILRPSTDNTPTLCTPFVFSLFAPHRPLFSRRTPDFATLCALFVFPFAQAQRLAFPSASPAKLSQAPNKIK
jgi:hypothetical protein